MLIAYVKIRLFQRLLASTLPDEPFVANELRAYFPSALRERYAGLMPAHRLAREVVSTVVANEMVNRCGITFAFRLGEETGADDADIARAYLTAREVLGVAGTWDAIEALDNVAGADVQMSMLRETRKLVERAARWLLRNRPRPLDIERDIGQFAEGVTVLRRELRNLVADSSRTAVDAASARLVERGVPEGLALEVASGNDLLSAMDVVEVATSAAISVEAAASVYFELGEKLDLHWLRDQIAALPRDNRWQALSRAALRDDLYAQLSALTLDSLRLDAGDATPAERVEAWLDQNRIPVARCRQILGDLRGRRTDRLHDALGRDGRDPHPAPDGVTAGCAGDGRGLQGIRREVGEPRSFAANQRHVAAVVPRLEPVDDMGQARRRLGEPGRVDLPHVAEAYHLGAGPGARDQCLHLVTGQVLRLVEDDVPVEKGAPAHEIQRANLDTALKQIVGRRAPPSRHRPPGRSGPRGCPSVPPSTGSSSPLRCRVGTRCRRRPAR